MGKRTWLNTQLADEYLPAIAKLPDTPTGHASAATLAAQLRQSWVDRHFTKLSQLQPLFDETRTQIKAKLGADHFSLKYFGLTTAEYTELNNQKLQRTADRNEDVKPIDQPDAIVAKAVALLEDSSHWFEIAAALAVLTGRRSSEILATAQFEKASQWSVTFTGALKRGGERQRLSFEIPTLTTSDRVITALVKLRQQLPDVIDLAPEEINRKYGDRVVQACDRHFTGLVPPRGNDNLYTHLFRAVYATIATFWYCPSWVEPTEYKAAIQGHYAVLDETDPTLRRSLTASRHYADYEIADSVIAQAGGKRKGIKLGYGGIVPIKIFQRPNALATPAPPQMPSTPQTQAMPQAASQPSKSKRTPRKSVWINYQDEELVRQVLSHFGHIDTTEAKIAAMSRWLHWSIETLKTVAPPAADASDQAQQAAIGTPANPPDPPPTEPTTLAATTPKAQAPSAEVDELKAMFTQTLQMFQALLQAQATNTTTHTAANGLARSAAATDRSDRDSATRSRSVASERPLNPDAEAATNTTLTQRRPSRSKSPEKATATAALTQQILQAIDDVMRYNLSIDQTQQPHKLKREITTNFLKALTPNQRLINRILDQQQQAIDHHHQQLHIQPGHNSSYREKITLADVQQSRPAGAIDSQA
ncbi:MAG: hypothetical protein F6K28_28830 [Microcoleus sp. SIO2G3]|nr:hypothetical protein [Microcoleus sp. SIO2G3]